MNFVIHFYVQFQKYLGDDREGLLQKNQCAEVLQGKYRTWFLEGCCPVIMIYHLALTSIDLIVEQHRAL